jgi:hypothetical protein
VAAKKERPYASPRTAFRQLPVPDFAKIRCSLSGGAGIAFQGRPQFARRAYRACLPAVVPRQQQQMIPFFIFVKLFIVRMVAHTVFPVKTLFQISAAGLKIFQKCETFHSFVETLWHFPPDML